MREDLAQQAAALEQSQAQVAQLQAELEETLPEGAQVGGRLMVTRLSSWPESTCQWGEGWWPVLLPRDANAAAEHQRRRQCSDGVV